MAIALGAVGAKAEATAADITPALPSGWATGDLLVAHVSVQLASAIATPGTWNLLTTQANAEVPNFLLHIFWKYAGAGETAPTFARGAAAVITGAISGWTGVPVRANPWLITTVKQQGSGTTMAGLTMTMPTITNAMAIWFWSQDDNGVTSTVTNGATVAYGGTNYNTTVGGGTNVSAAYKLVSTGATGATDMTSASGTQNMFIGNALDPTPSGSPRALQVRSQAVTRSYSY